ncbi:MAG: AAA family ATPase [Pseudomonadota bacterium]
MKRKDDAEAGQREVVEFLSSPSTHGGPVERVNTHISRLFMAGGYAWKLKRAVKTPYADFSTLALRERFCRREIAVNAAARDLYLGVAPVTRGPGGLSIGGDGEPLEWLVQMRRFDRSHELDRLADQRRLSRPMIERLALQIARLHRAAPEAPSAGGRVAVLATIRAIAAAFDSVDAGPAFATKVAAWRSAAEIRAACHSALLDQRRRLGQVKRCHGDLHLGNIVMLGETPVPFDAIEFDEGIATVDVMYDLAFTVMDLCARDCRGEASLLLSGYLGIAGGYAALPLMPLFVSMRAAIRSMVAATKGEGAKAEARLDAALTALEGRPVPRLIAVGGISGTGKSTLSAAIAPRLGPLAGGVVIRSDLSRKRIAGVDPGTRLPQSAYGVRMDRLVIRCMMLAARTVLRAGQPVVLDATFLGEDMRNALEGLATREGVPVEGLWLRTAAKTAAERVAARVHDASDATADVVMRQRFADAPPEGWHCLDASATPEGVASAAFAHLGI